MGDSIFDIGSNQVLLIVLLVLLVGVGAYVTYFRQRSTLQTLQQKVETRRQELQEIKRLQSTLTDAERRLASVRKRWQSRYKIVPDSTTSPAVLGYLSSLTETGFKSFNVTSATREERPGYRTYAMEVEGRAFYTNLYRFLWRVENSRPFYRVRNLSLDYQEERTTDEETGRTSMDVLVSFQMRVEAIYGVAGGMEAPEAADERELRGLPVARRTTGPPVPADVLPAAAPRINPFYPLVFEQVPPNEEGRLNVESARLVSIIGGQAIFQGPGGGLTRLEEGDRVYLGRIIEIDASAGRVTARLNRGGIIDTVERSLGSESPLQQKPQAGTAAPGGSSP